MREEVAAAKARIGEAVGVVAELAHQVHGAIGFTDEHPHHRYSRRIHTLNACFGDTVALRRSLARELVDRGVAPRGVRVWRPEA